MKNIWLMPVAAWLMVSAAACRRDNKAEQLAALDNAYRSGVLTEGEYNAKRLALMGPPPPPPAAPVTPPPAANPVPAPVANPAAPPRNPSSDKAAAPTGAAEALPAPLPLPAPPPRQPAPVVTRSQAAAETAPVTRPPATPVTQPPAASIAQPPAAPPAREPEPPAVETRPAPQTGAGESEPEPAPLAGCEDAEYKSGKVKGARQRFYPAPVDTVKRAAGAALRSLDFNIHKDAANEMEASKRRHMSAIVGAGGERLILRFEKAQQGGRAGTLVTGETRKTFVGRMAQKSWTNAVLAQIACHLRERR